MTVLRLFAVDDEPLALRRIELLLRQVQGVELVGTAESAEDAIRRLGEVRPDVLLLDVQMGGLDGFELIDAMGGRPLPQLIFITAHDAFAARAFSVSATDYLVKPVELDRLRAALEKARRVRRMCELEGGESQAKDLWVEKRGEMVRLSLDDVDWVRAERDYVLLHAGGNPYLLRHTMAGIEERLGRSDFLRIHRSALVRRERIAAIRRAGPRDILVQLATGEELRVGRTYLKRVRAMLRPELGAGLPPAAPSANSLGAWTRMRMTRS
jgi:DNA-binding LytR/AlgR family response regulator